MHHSPLHTTQSPPFPIRRGMDVFSAYQNQYLGTVVEVAFTGSPAGGEHAGAETTREHLIGTPELIHEQGATVSPTAGAGSKKSGEEMGPFPTIAAGNTGPINQSAVHNYATDPGQTYQGVAWCAVRPGRINLGPLTAPFYVPATAIRSISLERIVLDVEGSSVPAGWRQKPDTTPSL